MLEGFARVWTPVLPTGAIGTKPRRAVVAGTALVIWRDENRRPVAALDRCPHRGVALSLGSRTPEGRLACTFHGWEFGEGGRCEHVPFNPDSPRHRLGLTTLPHREAGGLFWVFTGFETDTEPEFPDSLADRSLIRFEHFEQWDAHWTRAMENMLDFPHLPYVHRTTIGRFVRAKQTRSSRLTMGLTDTATGYLLRTALDDNPPSADLHWYRPNSMVLDVVPKPKLLRLHIYCIPTEPDKVRMLLITTRNIAKLPGASLPIDRFNVTVLHQDRAVVESSDPVEVPADKLERSVPTDKPTLRFRTWYLRNLAGSAVVDPR